MAPEKLGCRFSLIASASTFIFWPLLPARRSRSVVPELSAGECSFWTAKVQRRRKTGKTSHNSHLRCRWICPGNKPQNAKVALDVKCCSDHRTDTGRKSQWKLWSRGGQSSFLEKWGRTAEHWHRQETRLPQEALLSTSASHRPPPWQTSHRVYLLQPLSSPFPEGCYDLRAKSWLLPGALSG